MENKSYYPDGSEEDQNSMHKDVTPPADQYSLPPPAYPPPSLPPPTHPPPPLPMMYQEKDFNQPFNQSYPSYNTTYQQSNPDNPPPNYSAVNPAFNPTYASVTPYPPPPQQHPAQPMTSQPPMTQHNTQQLTQGQQNCRRMRRIQWGFGVGIVVIVMAVIFSVVIPSLT